MTWFQRLLLLTIGLTFVLVIVGGTVRATDSGLGCPDWPLCHGKIIPQAEKHTLIEYSHRTMATVVGISFLALTWFTFKTERRKNPLVFWLTFTAGLLLLAQIILGGITVKQDLPAEIVALHLATAMTFLAVLIVTAVISLMRSRSAPPLREAGESPFARMAMLTAGAAFVTLVLGSYISGTDASLACSGWPLCNGSVLPGGDSAEGLHWLHRIVAGILGLLIAGTTYLAYEEGRPAVVRNAMLATCVLYVTQALVGAANIWTDLAAGVVVLHLSLASALWCMLVTAGALAWYLPGTERVRAQQGVAADAEKASQWAR